ncbi:Chromosomal replication initiator protein DnaA [Phycisphaerae bacterium RAS1]|nr:Chromosomal replication initiator protein DnaA [Phycisphaerae bacterium RAS1]
MGANILPWDALLQRVRTDQPALYRSWFEALPPGQLLNGQLLVPVANPAQASYLRDFCTEAFTQAAMAVSGHLVTIAFVPPANSPTTIATSRSGLTIVPLNPDYTFDQFVVGPSNRLAHASCRAVCSQPGSLYNPLFVHGASGLGKSHLLQAICAEMLRANPTLQVAYISCETFVNDFVRAIETGGLPTFRDSARHLDALVIDDVQFLANRESSQEELFHTFNTLYQGRRQVVFSADSPPSEIPTLEDRLISRFNWGLVAQIDPPTRETRQAILQKKARLRGSEVPLEVLDYIAERVSANIRLLEGALTKLITECQLSGKPMTLETAREVLPSYDGQNNRPLQLGDILQVVSQHFSIAIKELVGRRRTRSVSTPRQVAMYLSRHLTPLSLEEIGAQFGGRDHSTVLHAEKVIDAERGTNSELSDTLALLTRRLLNRK